MKKACLLLALMVLVIWLVHAAPVRERTNPAGNESSVSQTKEGSGLKY